MPLPGTLQPEELLHWSRLGLGAEVWSEPGRGLDWLHGDSLRGLGCAAPQPKEYGRRPGPTREEGHLCWGAHKERGGTAIGASLSTHALSGIRAPPT